MSYDITIPGKGYSSLNMMAFFEQFSQDLFFKRTVTLEKISKMSIVEFEYLLLYSAILPIVKLGKVVRN